MSQPNKPINPTEPYSAPIQVIPDNIPANSNTELVVKKKKKKKASKKKGLPIDIDGGFSKDNECGRLKDIGSGRPKYTIPDMFLRDTERELPKDIEVGLPKDIEVGLPKDIEVGLPKDIEGGLPKNIDGELPKDIEGGLPKNIEGELPKNIEGELPKNIEGELPIIQVNPIWFGPNGEILINKIPADIAEQMFRQVYPKKEKSDTKKNKKTRKNKKTSEMDPEKEYDIESNLDLKSKDVEESTNFHENRIEFIRNVYGILLLQLTFLVGLTSLAFVDSIGNFMRTNLALFSVASGLSSAIYLALLCKKNLARQSPSNSFILFFWSICKGYLLATACARCDPKVVMLAGLMTLFVAIGLSIYAFFAHINFTYLWGIAVVCFSMLIVWGIFSLIYGAIFYTLYCVIGIILFSCFLIYDTKRIIGGFGVEFTKDDYVYAAMLLYLDIVRLFYCFKRILGRIRN